MHFDLFLIHFGLEATQINTLFLYFTRWLSLEPFTQTTSIANAIARKGAMNAKYPGKSVAAISSQLFTLKGFLKDILGLCKIPPECPSHLFCRAPCSLTSYLR